MNADNFIKVLNIPYSPVEFLINRVQCSSSVYIAETFPLKSGCLFLDECMALGDEYIPLFNLDRFLQEYFNTVPVGEAHLALVRDTAAFPVQIQKKITDMRETLFCSKEVGTDKIAFRVASATVMMEVPLKDLRLQPRVMNTALEPDGILAVAFTGNGKMRYAVDLDILFEKKMIAAAEDRDENPDCR